MIQSILNQSYTDWELLLIDDGSKDGSPEICDRYAHSDDRIRVKHCPNRGVATARNEGLKMMRGGYLTFCDSDDWADSLWLEKLYETLVEQGADIVICDYYEEYTTKTVTKGVCDGSLDILNREEAIIQTFANNIPSCLWTMLMKREVVTESFSDYRMHEDYATLFKWMTCLNKVVRLHTPLYHYRQLESSIVHTCPEKNNLDFINATIERYHYLSMDLLSVPSVEVINFYYVEALLRASKNLVRSGLEDGMKRHYLEKIATELHSVSAPPLLRKLGLKYYLRYRLLLSSTHLFKSCVGNTGIFSLRHNRAYKNLFK